MVDIGVLLLRRKLVLKLDELKAAATLDRIHLISYFHLSETELRSQ